MSRFLIIDYVVDKALAIAREENIKLVDYCVCFPYTYVVVEGKDGKAMGVALTPFNEFNDIEYRETPLSKWDIYGLVKAAASYNLIAKTLGIAAINAVSQYLFLNEELTYKSIIDILSETTRGNERIAVIGYMTKLVDKLVEKGYNIVVFERDNTLRRSNVLPDFMEPRYLRNVDAAIITGATLVNETLDIVLNYINDKAHPVILTGPTAQIHRNLLPATKLTHIVSVRIVDIDEAIKWCKRGTADGLKVAGEGYTQILKL